MTRLTALRAADPEQLRPPVPYFGGKITHGRRIADLLPPHGHYVEPFGGSLAVLLAKTPSRMETVNDLDGDLMLFWRVLRDQPDELQRVCGLTPHSRAEHQAAYDLPDDLGDVERARRVWVQLTQGRAGLRTRTGWRHFQDPGRSGVGMPRYLRGYVDRMPAVVERLRGVSLECRPALELIEDYGRHEDVALYVDPPYLGSTRSNGAYLYEMGSEAEHRELAEALHQCRAAVVLSGYPSPLYDELYPDGAWHQVQWAAGTGQGGTWANRTEVIWMNRAPQGGLW